MNSLAVETIAQQIEELEPEDKLTLLSLLVESLRRQMRSTRRPLSTYLGVGASRGFQTAEEVDAFIRQERSLWEP